LCLFGPLQILSKRELSKTCQNPVRQLGGRRRPGRGDEHWGLMELIVLNIGLDLKVISPRLPAPSARRDLSNAIRADNCGGIQSIAPRAWPGSPANFPENA
jgi:hypothetical protein